MENADSIEKVFGVDFAVCTLETLAARAARHGGGQARLTRSGAMLQLAVRREKTAPELSGRPAADLHQIAESFLLALATEPVLARGGERIVPSLSLTVAPSGSAPCTGEAPSVHTLPGPSVHVRAPEPPAPPSDPVLRMRYVRDMAVAGEVHAAIADARIALMWRPVAGGEDARAIWYHEAEPCLIGTGGVALPASEFRPALERAGLTRLFDRHVLARTLDRLESSPGLRLGCTISAQSAMIDGWWHTPLARLAQQRDLAARLVVAISDLAECPPVHTMLAFVRHLRELGCTIALEGFGRTSDSFAQARALRPDIVKIEGAYLTSTLGGTNSRAVARLATAVELARSVAPAVVVQGVNNDREFEVAQSVGADWFKGDRLGSASFTLRTSGSRGGPADAAQALLHALSTRRAACDGSRFDVA